MDKIIKCRDAGLACDFIICGQTEREVLDKAREHVRILHDMKNPSMEFYNKARAASHEGDCEQESEAQKEFCLGGMCRV